MLLNIKKVFLFMFLLSINSFFSPINTSAAPTNPATNPDCNFRTATPKQMIECGSADSLKQAGAPVDKARGLNEILNVINNALAALAVFLSIIGALVASINIAKSQGSKLALEDAKQMLTNSIMAFVIAITIWLIVGLVLRTTGLN